MFTLDSISCGDGYTNAATLGPATAGSAGGYFNIITNDTFLQLGYGINGQIVYTAEMHVPIGTGTIPAGVVTARFRNYTAGSVAVVSGALAEKYEPIIALGSGGVVSPVATTEITGIIPAAGITPTAGTGFTYTHTNGTGVYVFTFTASPGFAATPVIVVSALSTRAAGILWGITAASAAGFTLNSWVATTGAVADAAFNFLAVPIA